MKTEAALILAGLILTGCSPNPRPPQQPAPSPTSARGSTVEIKDSGGRSTAQVLQGKFAGVDVFEVPGGGIKIKIRNSGSFDNSEGHDPIFVVDNLEVAAPGGVLQIDPNIIRKIEVEKVSSLYGIRGFS